MNYMLEDSFFSGPDMFGLGLPIMAFTLPVLIIWGLIWKGWALYLAARRGEIIWFVVLLIVNTVGLLEIFYIFVIAKQSDKKEGPVSVVNKGDRAN